MPSNPPPFVWVTQGRTEHAAFLLDDSKHSKLLVRWASTGETEWVDSCALARNLTPRKRNRPQVLASTTTLSSPQEPSVRLSQATRQADCPMNNHVADYPMNDYEGGEDDDEVKVLLTILPPTPEQPKKTPNHPKKRAPETPLSPKRLCLEQDPTMIRDDAQQKRQAEAAMPSPSPTNGDRCVDDEIQDASGGLDHYQDSQGSLIASFGITNPAKEIERCRVVTPTDSQNNASTRRNIFRDKSVSTVSTDATPKYSFVSSAYVQNLAEICHTIMNDRRWRTQDYQRPLFAWERGDDLGAVTIIQSVYSGPTQRKKIPCSCLLCCDKKPSPSGEPGDPNPDESSPRTDSQGEERSQADYRYLHLYCRLFYRKGPWFRLDDVFNKYYSPSKNSRSRHSTDDQKEALQGGKEFPPTATESQDDPMNNEISAIGQAMEIDEPDNTQKTQNDEGVIDCERFNQSLTSLEEMIHDIDRLASMGLIRTFRDEEECGRTAGAVSAEGSGVLLNAEERQNVVGKLGGMKRKKGRNTNISDEKGSPAKENLIWKQMSQQRSITSGIFGHQQGSGRALLPVCNHVNHEILSKLAAAVVTGAGNGENVPAKVLRTKIAQVKDVLSKSTNQSGTSTKLFPSKLVTCFRLREDPLLALRRCCRLYLCATHGPGDMRGNGSNGWRSLRKHTKDATSAPLARFVPPPDDNTWHHISYPHLSHMFGISSYPFMDAYHHHPVMVADVADGADQIACSSGGPSENVFATIEEFRLWEKWVEIRASVDYLAELNELMLYNERRRAREARESQKPKPSQGIDSKSNNKDNGVTDDSFIDHLGVLDETRRKCLIVHLCSFSPYSIELVESEIERAMKSMEARCSYEGAEKGSPLKISHAEKILVALSVVVTHVLAHRHASVPPTDATRKVGQPWLRHMWWEGVAAYCLWDCIPILEKRGFYELACKSLEVLTFGRCQNEAWRTQEERNRESLSWGVACTNQAGALPFCDVLISRRAKGKALDRLMIDHVHLLRQETKSNPAAETKPPCDDKKTSNQASVKTKIQATVNALFASLLPSLAQSGSIPFAAIRNLARRFKNPLTESVGDSTTAESRVLHLRLDSDNVSEEKGYRDWSPRVDETVAIAIVGEETSSGQRCSYVGFEETEAKHGKANPSSLNVEQLAMEYYSTGRLPTSDDKLRGGGWVGWHDEGGCVRALFRLLCSRPVLGMDGGCGSLQEGDVIMSTIHLSPYQGSPFDLHVGSWGCQGLPAETTMRGFFSLRKSKIEFFLDRLEQHSPQELSNAVYDAVKTRWEVAKEKNRSKPDTLLARDVATVRTLSMLAAGLGGPLLAAIFRCMLFDYRHYSGGLPDLLLTRTFFADAADASTAKPNLVNLGQWVGEGLSEEAVSEQETLHQASFLIDRDDEFLGCDKVGDSGTRSSSRWGRRQRTVKRDSAELGVPDMPARLVLVHEDRPVKVQCLFVEVKSANDRLDVRQEDWLNVLDRFGNARVCKFLKKGNKQQNKK